MSVCEVDGWLWLSGSGWRHVQRLRAAVVVAAARSLSGFAVNALTTTCIETTSPSAHLQSEREQQQHQRAAAGGRRSVREERKRRGARESSQSESERAAAVAADRRGISPLSGARRPSRVVQRWQQQQQQQLLSGSGGAALTLQYFVVLQKSPLPDDFQLAHNRRIRACRRQHSTRESRHGRAENKI